MTVIAGDDARPRNHPFLPTALTRDAARSFDRFAMAAGVPGIVLMENAGRAAADWLLELGAVGPFAVVCGKGNNGGDGAVIARWLANLGRDVWIERLFDPGELVGDAAIAWDSLRASAVAAQDVRADRLVFARRLVRAEWIVDAVLGTGASGLIRPDLAELLAMIQAVGRPIFAVDIPSGLDCDTGKPLGIALRAQATATFAALKQGMLAPGSRAYCGKVRVIPYGVSVCAGQPF